MAVSASRNYPGFSIGRVTKIHVFGLDTDAQNGLASRWKFLNCSDDPKRIIKMSIFAKFYCYFWAGVGNVLVGELCRLGFLLLGFFSIYTCFWRFLFIAPTNIFYEHIIVPIYFNFVGIFVNISKRKHERYRFHR